ncbi:hypothetical protein PPUJ20066_11670 [Pseudomonas putida]|nr:hypothetical protein PPUJ20066_11670 [Pseudomonas putida]
MGWVPLCCFAQFHGAWGQSLLAVIRNREDRTYKIARNGGQPLPSLPSILESVFRALAPQHLPVPLISDEGIMAHTKQAARLSVQRDGGLSTQAGG